MSVAGRKILVCVSGGIAAYKTVHVVRDLTLLGAEVHVLMTRSAERFVGKQTFASLSGNQVQTEIFGDTPEVPHVELARSADLVVVAPATANVMAKTAVGLADDIVSATLLTATCQILFVPAMHTEMWENPATRANLSTLSTRGVHILGPESGALSSGDEGPGRMVEPEEIVERALSLLGSSTELEGRTVVVTAGGTREAIDPVRYLGNNSSGRMGYLVAEEAVRRGAKVTLISAPSPLTPPPGADVVRVESAAEMREAVLAAAGTADVIVKAAAVADFRPDADSPTKLKKSGGPPDLKLVPTTDILAELGRSPELRKPGGVLVGFAAETEEDDVRLGELAALKLRNKGADLVVANRVGVEDSGFEVATSRAVLASASGVEDLGSTSKRAVAGALMDAAVELLQARR